MLEVKTLRHLRLLLTVPHVCDRVLMARTRPSAAAGNSLMMRGLTGARLLPTKGKERANRLFSITCRHAAISLARRLRGCELAHWCAIKGGFGSSPSAALGRRRPWILTFLPQIHVQPKREFRQGLFWPEATCYQDILCGNLKSLFSSSLTQMIWCRVSCGALPSALYNSGLTESL